MLIVPQRNKPLSEFQVAELTRLAEVLRSSGGTANLEEYRREHHLEADTFDCENLLALFPDEVMARGWPDTIYRFRRPRYRKPQGQRKLRFA